MIAELAFFALPVLLAVAAGSDLARFMIPNFLSLLLLGAFALFALAAGLSWGLLGSHILAGLLGLAIGFGLFAWGCIGGGDAKLFAATALWLGFKDLPTYVLLVGVCGGGLALAVLCLRQWPLPAFLLRQPWLVKLHAEDAGIPYGVALAMGAFVLLPSSEILRIAAAA